MFYGFVQVRSGFGIAMEQWTMLIDCACTGEQIILNISDIKKISNNHMHCCLRVGLNYVFLLNITIPQVM